MYIIYKDKLSIHPVYPVQVEITRENILSWEIENRGNKSPWLHIFFKDGKEFHSATSMIINYQTILKFIKSLPILKNNHTENQ